MVSAEGWTGFSCWSEGHVGKRWMMWETADLDVMVWMKAKVGSVVVETVAAMGKTDSSRRTGKTDSSKVGSVGMVET